MIAVRGEQVLERETGRLAAPAPSWPIRWRDALVEGSSLRGGAYGCALGSMANELADSDEDARASLAELFLAWRNSSRPGSGGCRPTARSAPTPIPARRSP